MLCRVVMLRQTLSHRETEAQRGCDTYWGDSVAGPGYEPRRSALEPTLLPLTRHAHVLTCAPCRPPGALTGQPCSRGTPQPAVSAWALAAQGGSADCLPYPKSREAPPALEFKTTLWWPTVSAVLLSFLPLNHQQGNRQGNSDPHLTLQV